MKNYNYFLIFRNYFFPQISHFCNYIIKISNLKCFSYILALILNYFLLFSPILLDPLSMSPQKALEMIGKTLQMQYERWQPRARYKQSLDPTVEEVKKLCTSLRRNAKEERVLFHYNGHGVPKPTSNGEIWVFNRVGIDYDSLPRHSLF